MGFYQICCIRYPINKKKFVIYNDIKSTFSNINISFPQDSVLGPFFKIYFNDLHIVFNSSISILFAGDTHFIVKITILIILNNYE